MVSIIMIKKILLVFIITGCASVKKIKESNTSKKTIKESKEIKKDSVSTIWGTLPTANMVVLDANDFKLRGDFTQSVDSGKGNITTIEKKGDKLIVKSNNSGSKNKTTNTNSSLSESVYTSEFVMNEISKTIKRTSLKYKILFFLLIAIWQRKLITQLIVSIIPSLSGKRIVKLFLGKTIS